MGGTTNLVRVDGWPCAPSTAAAFYRLKEAFDACQFKDNTGALVTLHVFSGYRSYDEQRAIFLARYEPQAYGTGPYNDVRWWNGVRYVRTSGEGTVAVPGTSNHGDGKALDIYDSGADAGVTRYGNARSAWVRDNCSRFGFYADGYHNFKEPWHIKYTAGDPWVVPAAPASIDTEEVDDMSAEAERKINELHAALMPGQAGVRHDGAVFALIQQAAANGAILQDLYRALTPGQAGVRHDGPVFALIRDTAAKVTALDAAVTALATAQGLDPVELREAIGDAVKEALDGFQLTFSATEAEQQDGA